MRLHCRQDSGGIGHVLMILFDYVGFFVTGIDSFRCGRPPNGRPGKALRFVGRLIDALVARLLNVSVGS